MNEDEIAQENASGGEGLKNNTLSEDGRTRKNGDDSAHGVEGRHVYDKVDIARPHWIYLNYGNPGTSPARSSLMKEQQLKESLLSGQNFKSGNRASVIIKRSKEQEEIESDSDNESQDMSKVNTNDSLRCNENISDIEASEENVASLHGTSEQVPVASNVNTSERYGNLQHGSAAPGIQYVGRRLMHRGYAMLPGMGPVFDQGIPVGGDQSYYENFMSLQQQFVPMSNVPAETTSSQPQAQPTTSSGANNDHAHQRSQEKLLNASKPYASPVHHTSVVSPASSLEEKRLTNSPAVKSESGSQAPVTVAEDSDGKRGVQAKLKGKPKPASGTSKTEIKCEQCGRTFGSSSALAKHKLTFSDERKYVCGTCGKGFKRQDHLNGHMVTHRDRKPYKCYFRDCDKSFCDMRSLRQHRENHHTVNGMSDSRTHGAVSPCSDKPTVVNVERADSPRNLTKLVKGRSLKDRTDHLHASGYDSGRSSGRFTPGSTHDPGVTRERPTNLPLEGPALNPLTASEEVVGNSGEQSVREKSTDAPKPILAGDLLKQAAERFKTQQIGRNLGDMWPERFQQQPYMVYHPYGTSEQQWYPTMYAQNPRFVYQYHSVFPSVYQVPVTGLVSEPRQRMMSDSDTPEVTKTVGGSSQLKPLPSQENNGPTDAMQLAYLRQHQVGRPTGTPTDPTAVAGESAKELGHFRYAGEGYYGAHPRGTQWQQELNLPSSPSRAYDEQVSLQEESPGREQKAGKKRKVQEMMTEEIVEPQGKKKKRKKGKAEQGTEADDPLLAEPSIPTAHGSNHGLTPAAYFSGNPLHNVQYPQNYPSPDIYTYHHSAPSTSSTPGGSLGIDSYLFRGSGLSTVTQVEPEKNTRLSTQDVPSHDPGTAGPVPAPLHSGVVEEYSRKRKNLERHKVRQRDKVPREIKAQGPEAKLAYVNALKTGKVKVYRARIMLIGQDRAGKTSLKKSFLGLPFNPEEDSTDGIEVDPSKFEVDIDQVKNWKLTDKKLSVSQFALDLAKMVAKEIQERDKDKEVSQEGDEEDSDDDYEKGREKQREKKSKQDYPDEDTNKQTKMGQSGLNSLGEPRLSKPPVVNSQMNQDTSRNASKETKTEAPDVELNIDATSPPEEFTDCLDQLLKGLNLQTDVTTVEHRMILDLWDFAGQQLYYASYPVFLSPRAVYMLVYDLSKGLNDPAQPYFKQGNRKIRLPNPNKETNMENLLSWLVSVSSICSSESEKAVKDQPHCRPPVFIVGTHADKQHQKDIDKIELQIKREIFENSENVIRPIFSVDNTQGSSDRGVSALQKRMIEVLKQEPYMGEETPIRWFNFEKVVKTLVAKKVYHLNMEQLQTIIQKHCFIENKDEVATMLNFYHDLGVIVKHGNTVILQAEWLIKLFKQLITVRCFDDMEPRCCRWWKEMEKTGVLNMELVEHVFSEFCQQEVVKEDILEMMMKFGLIVQFALSPTEKKYFVPCQLRSPPDILCIKELSPGDPCPLYLDFQRMGYVPHGLYLQLVSRCTEWCSTRGFEKPPKLYDGASLFFIGKGLTHHMMLVCKKRFIKIVLKQIKQSDGSSCEPVSAKETPILVRTSLNEMMQNLLETLPWFKNVGYELCVKCPYCLKVQKPCDNHGEFPCHKERCLCLLTVAPDGSCEYCTESHLDEIVPLPELKRWYSSSREDSSIKDTSEEEVETGTVSKKQLPAPIPQLPEKNDYQVKEGIPSNDELEHLSVEVDDWEKLGRRLGFTQAELTALHKDKEKWSEKALAMLMKWRERKGSSATYRCLYDALCHVLVNRKDLAEKFCCSCSKPEG